MYHIAYDDLWVIDWPRSHLISHHMGSYELKNPFHWSKKAVLGTDNSLACQLEYI